MQNAQLLINNHYELQGIMLSILAKLSVIKFQNFGMECFNTLKDLMQSGRELEDLITEILTNEVINQMKQPDPTVIPVSLLKGLNELVEESENSDMLTGMFDNNSFSQWMRAYSKLVEVCKKQMVMMGNDEHYDSIIALLSNSVQGNPTNVQKVLDKKLIPHITLVIQNSNWEHDRYIPCLKLIAALANAETEAANEFMDAVVQNNLIKRIDESLAIYKNNKTLFDENSQETVEQQMLKYQTFAAEVKTLGGLL